LKNVGEPIEYWKMFAAAMLQQISFDSEKFAIVLFVTKHYQPFCVRTGGDALVRLPCSGLLSRI